MNDTSAPVKPVPPKPNWEFKYPIVPSRVVENFKRPAQAMIDAAKAADVPDISERVGAMYTMDGRIRPAYMPIRKAVGPAFTVKVPPGDNLMVKKALQMAAPGDIIVIDARGHENWAVGGANMAVQACRRGVAGMVVDGYYRDMEQLQEMDFPVFLKGVSPSSGPKIGPGEINVPVCCGGVIVEPGDIVAADREGIAVIPQRAVQAVLDMVKKSKVSLETRLSDDDPQMEYFDELLRYRGCVWEPGEK